MGLKAGEYAGRYKTWAPAASTSGLIGFLQMSFGAIATLALGALLDDGQGALVAFTAGAVALSALSLALIGLRR